MNGLCLGLALSALFFLVHLVWWRLSRPRATARALFLGLAGGLVAAALGIPLATGGLGLGYDLGAHLQGLLLAAALGAAYIATYPALEVTSPTLAILDDIARSGRSGLDHRALVAKMDDGFLLLPRIADLENEGLVALSGDHYLLTAKGKRVAALFIRLRSLLRLPAGG